MKTKLSARPICAVALSVVTCLVGNVATSQELPQPALARPQLPDNQLPKDQPEKFVVEDPADDAEPEVLQRGPVHEAFAEPFDLDGRAIDAIIVPREPPAPIEELPPEIRPEGENVRWVSGYWMWSVEQDDFVWVSGVWRRIPPGREWTPGRWESVAEGFRWVSGYWADEAIDQAQFLPEPPETLEVGPNGPAPSDEHFWIPGCWTWTAQRYAWRPGYWYQGQPNWIWTPDHYAWTPRGYLFIGGYWDRPIVDRGFLYAPVYWPQRRVGFYAGRYTPRFAVNVGVLLGNLFVNRGYHHYYFGQFDNRFRNRYGLYPWFDVYRGHRTRGYDPLLAYHRWNNHRQNPNWLRDLQSDFQREHDVGPQDRDRRVARTDTRGRPGDQGARRQSLVEPATRLANDPRTKGKITHLSDSQVKQAQRDAHRRAAAAERRYVGKPIPETNNDLARGRARGAVDQRADVRASRPGNPQTRGGEAVNQGRRAVDPSANGRPAAASDAQLRNQLQNRLRGQQDQLRSRGRPRTGAPAAAPQAQPQQGRRQQALGQPQQQTGRSASPQQNRQRWAPPARSGLQQPAVQGPRSTGPPIYRQRSNPSTIQPRTALPQRATAQPRGSAPRQYAPQRQYRGQPAASAAPQQFSRPTPSARGRSGGNAAPARQRGSRGGSANRGRGGGGGGGGGGKGKGRGR